MIHHFQGFRAAFTGCPTMFADRKSQFVDTLRWQVPVIDTRYEIDVYDDERAAYIAALDATGRHQGSLRLLPTLGPHILADIFPYLSIAPLPRGADVLEITRLCLPGRHSTGERLLLRHALVRAMVDHAVDAGISQLTGVVTARFRDAVLAMGWRCCALGSAQDGLGAFAVHIDRATPGLLAAAGIGAAPAAAAA